MYIQRIHRHFNRALEKYGPSREVTLEECAQAFDMLMVEVQPYFDVYLQDSTKLDPHAVLGHWRETGKITQEEQVQFTVMLRGQRVAPVSKLVKDGLNMHAATVQYWYGKERGPWMDGPCDCPDKSALKDAIDVLGGIAGSIGGSGILGALGAYLASTGYMITSDPSWLSGGVGANGELITGYGRGPVY